MKISNDRLLIFVLTCVYTAFGKLDTAAVSLLAVVGVGTAAADVVDMFAADDVDVVAVASSGGWLIAIMVE